MQMKDVSRFAKNIGGVFSKNSPSILTGVAVAGLVTTTILAVRATPKALMLLDDEQDSRKRESINGNIEPLTKKDIIKITWKLYLPSIATGITTIVCIVGANAVNLRRNAALASLYGLTEAAFKEYKSKVVETIGRNKELKVRDDISADKIKSNPIGKNEVIITGKGDVICYDSMSGRYFKSNIEEIKKIVNELNRTLISDMFVSVNEFYDRIGLANTALGHLMGWDLDNGLVEISFSTQLTENDEPCLVLNYTVIPKFIE
jgi:hypothetical protein